MVKLLHRIKKVRLLEFIFPDFDVSDTQLFGLLEDGGVVPIWEAMGLIRATDDLAVNITRILLQDFKQVALILSFAREPPHAGPNTMV